MESASTSIGSISSAPFDIFALSKAFSRGTRKQVIEPILDCDLGGLKLIIMRLCKFLARSEEDANKIHAVLSGSAEKNTYSIAGSGSATDWFMFATKLFAASRQALCLSLRPGHHIACAEVEEESILDIMQSEKYVFLAGQSERVMPIDSIVVDTITSRFVGCGGKICLDEITDSSSPVTFHVCTSGRYDSVSGHRPAWKYYGPHCSTLIAEFEGNVLVIQRCAAKEQVTRYGRKQIWYLGPPLVHTREESSPFSDKGGLLSFSKNELIQFDWRDKLIELF